MTTNTHTVTPVLNTQNITVTSLFLCVIGGTSGTSAPAWNNGVNTTTNDNTVAWQNMGSQIPVWADIGATQKVAKETQVTGSGWFQNVQQFGKTGAAAPTWSTTLGGSTADNGYAYMWKNTGAIAPGTPAGPWIYASSGKEFNHRRDQRQRAPFQRRSMWQSETRRFSQAQASPIRRFDQLVLWRTTQGAINAHPVRHHPEPRSWGTWIYTDTKLDTGSTLSGRADRNANDPPPTGATAPSSISRASGSWKDNIIQYSQTPGSTAGSAFSAFQPVKQPQCAGADHSPGPNQCAGRRAARFQHIGNLHRSRHAARRQTRFSSRQFAEKINLLNYDSLDVFGTQIFLMESNFKVSSLTIEYPFNPQSGYSEIGYPIGDQFLNVSTGVADARAGTSTRAAPAISHGIRIAPQTPRCMWLMVRSDGSA
jgi:hypothetical protein